MAGEFDSMVDDAREMIDEAGRTVTFYQLDGTAADPDKPWNGTGQQTKINPVTTQAVFVPVHSLVNLGFKSRDDELLKSLENAVIFAPPITGEDLTTYHVLEDGGQLWSLVTIEALRPGDAVLLLAAGVARATVKPVA